MSVFIYTTLFIFILFCNVFFNLKHKKCRHYSFRNSKWRQKGSFLTLVPHMGRVEYRIGEKMVGFYKNSKLFGKIENGVIYLLDSLGQLKKLGANIVLKESVFILRAQIAYNAV